MRLLHGGHDRLRSGTAARQHQAYPAGDRQSHAGQHLPLRYVSAHSARGRNGREAITGGASMNPFEPERYELEAGPAYTFDLDISRRDIFKLLGGGIVVLSILSDAGAQESGGGGRRGGAGQRAPQEIGAWIHIGEDGAVTVYTGKTEVGQNIRTSLTQVVCEELRVPMTSVRLVMADTSLTPWDGGTTGSRTTPDMATRLRKVSAAARELLIDQAAKTWNADRAALLAADGRVSDGANRSVTYSE